MPITFHPHIGTNYGRSPIGRLLVIGDSHYWPYHPQPVQHSPDFTKNVVADDKSVGARFFQSVARLFGKNSFTDLRNDVAFANAVQEFMPDASAKPSAAQIAASEDAIRGYLDATDAVRAVMFSSRIWEGLFNNPKDWGKYVETLEVGGKKATVWQWAKRNGKTCHAIGLHHPSARSWKAEDWRPLLDAFLNKY